MRVEAPKLRAGHDLKKSSMPLDQLQAMLLDDAVATFLMN